MKKVKKVLKRSNKQLAPVALSTTTWVGAGIGLGAVAGLAYYFRQDIMKMLGLGDMTVSPEVRAKLPIAQPLKTVSDMEGNYDIDGVSFDNEGVIVGSDDTKHVSI